MQYQVKVSDEPKFKFAEQPNKVVMEHEDEYKSDSEAPSSLFTEEDLTDNHLPSENIEQGQKRRQSDKDLTGRLANIRTTTRSLLNSEPSLKDNKDLSKSLEKKADMSPLTSNPQLKNALQQIFQLKNNLKQAQHTLKNTENSIFEEETRQIDLKATLEYLKAVSESDSKKNKRNCSCGFFNFL